MHLNSIRLVPIPEDASSNPAQDNKFFIVPCSQINMILVFHISEDGFSNNLYLFMLFHMKLCDVSVTQGKKKNLMY